MAPPSNCLSPIGEKAILHGLYKQIKGEFYTAVTRPPAVYRGNPFVIEAGLAFGQGPDQATPAAEAPEASPLAEGEGREDDERARPRHPLREPRAAPLPAVGLRDLQGGARDRLAELRHRPSPGARSPPGPMVVFVHMASVWVPFTSESKEAIADYDEIRKEIKLALQECGRRLGVFLRRRERAKSEFRRRNIFELYIEEVVEACARLKGARLPKQRLKDQLLKIAVKRTGGTRTDEILGQRQRARGPPPLDHRHRRGRRRARRRSCRRGGSADAEPVEPRTVTSDGTGPHANGGPPRRQEQGGARRAGQGRQPHAAPRGRRGREPHGGEGEAPGVVEKKLVGVADIVITGRRAEQGPDPRHPRPRASPTSASTRSAASSRWASRKQARTFFNVGMAKKFMQTVLVADALAELQRADLTTSLREIYYRTKHTMKGSHENTFDNQNESDPLIEDLEVTLAALREELHVRAENARQHRGPARARRRRRPGGLRAPRQGRLLGALHRRARVSSRSGAARPTSSCWSRRAPSGTGSRRTSSGAGTTACS